MHDIKINFLGENPEPSKKKLFFFLKIFGAAVTAVILFAFLVSTTNISEGSLLAQMPIIKQVNRLIHSADRKLDGQSDDRINILLLGMGGVRHDGPFLTDTIILASIKPKTKQIAFLSIPRDLAVPIPGLGQYKINHANSIGEIRESGSGGEFTKNLLSDFFQIPVHYYVRVDFNGFINLIDNLGGVDIYVEKSFVDNLYPTGSNGDVMTISFREGWEHMDGDRALEFARSRHGGNSEGSDFARARRQQKILEAVKSKVFSLGTLRSPQRINSVIDSLKENVRTNLSPLETLSFARLLGSLDTTNIITKVLETGPEELLTSTIGSDGAYLLIPKQNDWSPILSLIKNIFSETAATNQPPTRPLRVEIQNGTRIMGLAARTAETISRQGFQIVKIGNSENRSVEKTTIYDLTEGKENEALEKLRGLLDADTGTALSAAAAPNTDFLIILGSNDNL